MPGWAGGKYCVGHYATVTVIILNKHLHNCSVNGNNLNIQCSLCLLCEAIG